MACACSEILFSPKGYAVLIHTVTQSYIDYIIPREIKQVPRPSVVSMYISTPCSQPSTTDNKVELTGAGSGGGEFLFNVCRVLV